MGENVLQSSCFQQYAKLACCPHYFEVLENHQWLIISQGFNRQFKNNNSLLIDFPSCGAEVVEGNFAYCLQITRTRKNYRRLLNWRRYKLISHNLIVFLFLVEICIEKAFLAFLVHKLAIAFSAFTMTRYDGSVFVMLVNVFSYYIVHCLIKLNFATSWWLS